MTHPALLMLKVWTMCVLMYTVLPFYLVDKALTLEGVVVFLLFLGFFCGGAMMIEPAQRRRNLPVRQYRIDFSSTDALLTVAGVITIAAFLLDLRDKSVIDIALAYELRSERAGALLKGEASSSTLAFQVGFLTYPAAYAYAVRMIVFEPRLSLWRLAAFGFLPVLLATMAMGGRSPLLYGIVVCLLSAGARRAYRDRQGQPQVKPRKAGARFVKTLGIAAVVFGAMYYFVAVFFTRAELFGGGAGMFKVAEESWGIGFRGPVADAMFYVLGTEWTYIVFVFNWYVVQGLLMANFLFTDYQSPMQLGVYGVDLVSALVRRFDGPLVARHFDALQQIGTYGFFPSAWGSLYVDLWWFGLAASAVWGALATLVYRNIRLARDSRWLIFAPFVTMGIVFSFINTPIGFSNGLVTHAWLLFAFFKLRRRPVPVQPSDFGAHRQLPSPTSN